MKRVTRDIEPYQARDLLERVPRACIAFASDGGPQAQPVDLVWQDNRYLVGIPGQAGRQPASGDEIVLLVDEGVHLFDLRAIYVRGSLKAAAAPGNTPTGLMWFEVLPIKTVAWDYGMLREVPDEGG